MADLAPHPVPDPGVRRTPTPGRAAIAAAARSELVDNILPFWASVAMDHERGGVHGWISNDLQVDDTVERTAVLCARVLWSFSAAARELDDEAYLATARGAYDYLLAHFVDPEHGGVFWSVAADGAVLDDRKQTYAQAFVVYALAEYTRVTRDLAALELAGELFGLIEDHAADKVHGGYLEARGRDWRPIADVRLSPKDLNAPKSMNTLLHVMEAYTTLVDVTGSDRARRRLGDLVAVILDRVVDADAGRLRLFLDVDWRPLSDVVSYGHDIEAAWLLVAGARASDDAALVTRAQAAALALADGVQRDGRDLDGAVLYEHRPGRGGAGETDRSSHWWAQAEGVVGFLEAFRLSDDERFAEAAADCWRVIEDHHVDRFYGDWIKVLDADRRPVPAHPKVGPWECPYHHVRACLEIIRRIPNNH